MKFYVFASLSCGSSRFVLELQRLRRTPSDERRAPKSSMKQRSAKMEREAHWQVFALRARLVKSGGVCAAYEVGGRAGGSEAHPPPQSWNTRCHSGMLFILRNFLFIWMPSYTCQVVLLFQAYFNENIANYSHVHFPKK